MIDYTIRRSRRTRRMSITVQLDGAVVATAPLSVPDEMVRNFILRKLPWIEEKVAHFKKAGFIMLPRASKAEFQKYKKEALILATAKARYWNERYGFVWNTIGIKNQKTRWGSCSKRGALNFNYRIIFLPPELQDYLVVHELCHLGSFDHSKKFWSLVGRTVTDYREKSLQLKRYR